MKLKNSKLFSLLLDESVYWVISNRYFNTYSMFTISSLFTYDISSRGQHNNVSKIVTYSKKEVGHICPNSFVPKWFPLGWSISWYNTRTALIVHHFSSHRVKQISKNTSLYHRYIRQKISTCISLNIIYTCIMFT